MSFIFLFILTLCSQVSTLSHESFCTVPVVCLILNTQLIYRSSRMSALSHKQLFYSSHGLLSAAHSLFLPFQSSICSQSHTVFIPFQLSLSHQSFWTVSFICLQRAIRILFLSFESYAYFQSPNILHHSSHVSALSYTHLFYHSIFCLLSAT